ncbi:RusA family crossover junction endodeoxyribonuclease [Erysipelothrix tonsillarum]|uniref:RusA family crossover junction endodeoxyribonuclease n=1 Tax=Erysipelothrix tonsillarum TaxID=38402 RepID=UPI0039E0D249
MWFYKERLEHKRGSCKPVKSNFDNIQKLLLDCMTYLGLWNNDEQIHRCFSRNCTIKFQESISKSTSWRWRYDRQLVVVFEGITSHAGNCNCL